MLGSTFKTADRNGERIYLQGVRVCGLSEGFDAGSFRVELFLWCLFIVPGLIYSIWRLRMRSEKRCPSCGGVDTMIPIDSPMGRKITDELLANQRKASTVVTAIAFLAALAVPSARAQNPHPRGTLRLADGTEVQLSLLETVSSANARLGERVHFQVTSEVRVNGVTVIPNGAGALGTVTAAQRSRRFGRAGVLQLSLESVSLADGEYAPLRATETSVGDSDSETFTGNVIATASTSFWPAAPALLLMHGEDTTMPEGTRITAYIASDLELDPAKFPPPMDYGPTPGTIPAAAPAPAAPAAPPAPPARRDATYPGYVILP